MISTNNVSALADLAEAAYIDFGIVPFGGLTDSDLKRKLSSKEIDWPESRREEFARHWRVVAHQPNQASGFSATVFERLSPQSGEPRYVLAMRGTEFPGQLYADLASADLAELVGHSLAWGQIIDMYNWWQQISTPEGQEAKQFQAVQVFEEQEQGQAIIGLEPALGLLSEPPAWLLQETASVAGLGLVDGSAVDVTGHSLGGHLASAFSRLFADQTHEVLSVNGAGYSIIGRTNGNVDYVFRTLGGAPAFDASKIVNVYGDRGPELVTQDYDLGLAQPGASYPVFIESAWIDNTFGHGSGGMANALSLYEVFRRLEGHVGDSTSAMLARYRPLMEALSADQDATVEAGLDAIRRLFLGDSAIETLRNDSQSYHGNRIELLEDYFFDFHE